MISMRDLCLLLVLVPAVATAQDRQQVATSMEGMVVTAHPLATYAGQRILDAGGNAADAAVAAAFAVAVVCPSMNSIGGRNQILVRLPSGEVHRGNVDVASHRLDDPTLDHDRPYGSMVCPETVTIRAPVIA
jgi:Gamma-glutamyltranspeptidase